MIKESTLFNDIMTAISLLEISFTLLAQISNTETCSIDAAYLTLHQLLHICMDSNNKELSNVKKSLKSNRLKNNLLQLVIRSTNKLLEVKPSIINVINAMIKHNVYFTNMKCIIEFRVQ